MLPIYGECCQNPGSDSQNQQKTKKKQKKRNQGKNAKEQPVISASVSVPHIVVMGEGGGARAGAAARSGCPTYFPFTSRVTSP